MKIVLIIPHRFYPYAFATNEIDTETNIEIEDANLGLVFDNETEFKQFQNTYKGHQWAKVKELKLNKH